MLSYDETAVRVSLTLHPGPTPQAWSDPRPGPLAIAPQKVAASSLTRPNLSSTFHALFRVPK
jgi:hypothetical protein